MRAGFLRIMKQRGGPILIKNINTVSAAGSKRAATRVTGCGGGTSDPCPPGKKVLGGKLNTGEGSSVYSVGVLKF